MKCIQANLHHAKAASAEICRRFASGNTNIGLIQEPWLHRGQIKGLKIPNTKVIYDTGAAKPRAALIIDTNIKHLPLTEYTNGDTAAVLVEADLNGKKIEIVIVSAYFPGDANEIPPANVTELVSYCRANNKTLILGCDANAHNTIWGSTDTNTRGESLLEYLINTNMAIANRGNKPTFINAIRQEVLDLTLVTNNSVDMIRNWVVSEEDSMSDHKHIFFEIKGLVNTTIQYRSPRATNWDDYSVCLDSKLSETTLLIESTEELDESVDTLTDSIISSYHESSPLKTKSSTKRVPWWNKTLENLRRLTRAKFNNAKKYNTWDDYRESLTLYNKELRKSKRKSWKNFCEELDNTPATARIQKSLAKGTTNTIGTLKAPDGTYTTNFENTLELLLRTHFPECVSSTTVDNEPAELGHNLHRASNTIINKIITFERVEWAINSFKPYKSAGPDGIFPALLTNGTAKLTLTLVRVFRASLMLGYIPKLWREVKVVFLPKGGNKPPESPKSYRPISLMSFMLKTMEKLLDCHLREETLNITPLHKLQFAYQKGKSTVTALHTIVHDIEKTLNRKETALCAFMDIEGAFDNANFKAIELALSKRGTNTAIVKWIGSMLNQRRITASLGQTCLSITTVKGCPQGGVLSPLLWSVLVDELIQILNNKGYKTIGYADDISVIIEGKHEGTIGNLMQDALDITGRWCKKEGLSINPAKTTIIPFTRKRAIDIPTLNIEGVEVPLKEEVKYLGVTLDKKLTWGAHLDSVTKKATKSLWATRQLLGKTWGLKPKMTYWIYTQMVRPIILYGALVWWGRTKQANAVTKLSKVQRLACISITGAMKTTPTAGLEALLNLIPLHLAIQEEAARQALSIMTTYNLKRGNFTGHLEILNRVTHAVDMNQANDHTDTVLNFTKRYKVIIPSRDEWDKSPTWLSDDSQKWFTDGSKTLQGVGAGVVGPRAHKSITLAADTTIFQAELYAILEAVDILNSRGYIRVKINILSDSQSVLKALKGYTFNSKVLLECNQALNDLASDNKVTLIWVPGHKGHEGNEKADLEARKGAERPFIGPTPSFGFNKNNLKQETKKWIHSKTLEYWNKSVGLVHSKKFLSFSAARADTALSLDRNNLRLLTGALTGHYACNKHLFKLGITDSSTCRYCCNEEESMEHLITECEALAQRRNRLLGSYILEDNELQTLPPKELVRFLGILNN